jgi:hypothetical protein
MMRDLALTLKRCQEARITETLSRNHARSAPIGAWGLGQAAFHRGQ